MEKCFLLVFALFKESKQGQDKIILLLIVILSPPHPFFFFEFLLVFRLRVVKPKTKINPWGQWELHIPWGQWELNVKSRKPPEVRENADNWVATSFESDEFEFERVLRGSGTMTEPNQSNTESHLTFNWKFFCVTLSILCLTFVRSLEEMVTRGKVQW